MSLLSSDGPPTPPALDLKARAALENLRLHGTSENTLRAYERDLIYLTAWKQAAFGQALEWPEQDDVALRFILDHSRELTGA